MDRGASSLAARNVFAYIDKKVTNSKPVKNFASGGLLSKPQSGKMENRHPEPVELVLAVRKAFENA